MANLLSLLELIGNILVLPSVYVLFSLHGRLSKMEGMLEIALQKVKTSEKKDGQ